MKKVATLVAAMASLALVVGLIAGPATGAKSTKKQSIADIASGSKQFDTLTSLLVKADLVETLDGKGKFTVFAPTDAAFAKVPQSTLDGLAADPEQLKAVLLYHVANGKLTARKVVRRSSIKTLNGASVKVRATKKGVRINDARVIKADVRAKNGVIHAIDRRAAAALELAPPSSPSKRPRCSQPGAVSLGCSRWIGSAPEVAKHHDGGLRWRTVRRPRRFRGRITSTRSPSGSTSATCASRTGARGRASRRSTSTARA